MKPRSKREIEVFALSAKMPHITETQKQYAIEHCFVPQGIIRGKKSKECICLECGATFEMDTLLDHLAGIECPNCGKKLEIEFSRRKRMKKIRSSFQIVTTKKEYQVIRMFYLSKITVPLYPAIYEINEVVQRYIQPNKKDIIMARPRTLGLYIDSYIFHKPMSIKIETDYTPYDVSADIVYPRWKVLQVVKRNGFCQELKKHCPKIVIKNLLDDNLFETLVKVKRFDIVRNLDLSFIHNYWSQIKMIVRKKYYPTDYQMWEDTIKMASINGFDAMSPKYVLPENLEKIHDSLVKKINKKKEKEEIERQRANDVKYRKFYGELLNIVIEQGDIKIAPLQCYKDFYEEGVEMHHCVKTYFLKKESLILSAKKGDKRIATIELKMKDFSINQCRGCCNKQPEEYNVICNIINTNKNIFSKSLRRKNDICSV